MSNYFSHVHNKQSIHPQITNHPSFIHQSSIIRPPFTNHSPTNHPPITHNSPTNHPQFIHQSPIIHPPMTHTIHLLLYICSKEPRLRARDFVAGNKNQLYHLKRMGIKIVTMSDGRVQLLHTASEVGTGSALEKTALWHWKCKSARGSFGNDLGSEENHQRLVQQNIKAQKLFKVIVSRSKIDFQATQYVLGKHFNF